MDLLRFFHSELERHELVSRATRRAVEEPFTRLVAACTASLRRGGKLLFFGNGGSAADAQHLATELCVRYAKDRPAIAALALTTDSSALSAIGNDLGFARLFERQVEALSRRVDVAIGISTSGNSENVLRGLEAARRCGAVAAGLAGRDGGKLRGLAEPLVVVPSAETPRIQEMHILIGHMLCAAIERELELT